MNRLLAVETSGERCSVALSLNGTIRLVEHHEPLKHAERLLPAVHAVLDEAGVALTSLDGIVFGRGPGSFTSLRIGIGVVQGLAWGADIPVVPISSLACVAQQAAHLGAGHVLVAMDARMAEVFHALFQFDAAGVPRAVAGESVSDPVLLGAPEPANTVAAGNGFELYPDLARLGGSMRQMRPDLLPTATALMPLALDWLNQNSPLPAELAQPVYVRNRVAEKPGQV